MRPPRQPASAFYHPLELALGTPATVRILRELCLHGDALPVSLLADRTGLSRQGALAAVNRLIRSGFLESVGFGRSVSYRVNEKYPLAAPLTGLFEEEAERVGRVFREIYEFIEHTISKPVSVWLYGSVARHEDSDSSDMDILVVTPNASIGGMADELARRLSLLGEWGILPSVAEATARDIAALARRSPDQWETIRRDAVVLFGASPDEVSNG